MGATTGLKNALKQIRFNITRHINRWYELLGNTITDYAIPYTVSDAVSQPKVGEVAYTTYVPAPGEPNPPLYNMNFWDGQQWVTIAGATGGAPSTFFPTFDDDTSNDVALYREIDGGVFPTVVRWRKTPGGTIIQEKTITRDAQQRPTLVVWKYYNSSGNLLRIVSDAITYSGSSVVESSRTRTLS